MKKYEINRENGNPENKQTRKPHLSLKVLRDFGKLSLNFYFEDITGLNKTQAENKIIPIIKYFKLNINENTAYQNLGNAVKALLK